MGVHLKAKQDPHQCRYISCADLPEREFPDGVRLCARHALGYAPALADIEGEPWPEGGPEPLPAIGRVIAVAPPRRRARPSRAQPPSPAPAAPTEAPRPRLRRRRRRE